MTSQGLRMRSTGVGSFHKRNFAAETAGRGAEAELVAAERSTEVVANIAGLGMKEGRKAHEPGCHNHGLDGPVVGGDDKRQDQCSSWCLWIGLLVKPWDAFDESTSPEVASSTQPGPVTIRSEFQGGLAGICYGGQAQRNGCVSVCSKQHWVTKDSVRRLGLEDCS
jgi:hypothetical protein